MTELVAWVFSTVDWYSLLGAMVFQLALGIATRGTTFEAGPTWFVTNWRWWCVTCGAVAYGALAWGPR